MRDGDYIFLYETISNFVLKILSYSSPSKTIHDQITLDLINRSEFDFIFFFLFLFLRSEFRQPEDGLLPKETPQVGPLAE